MTAIKILQMVASSHGGGATHVRDLALGLPADRYTTTVAMPLDDGNVAPEDFTTAGIEFIPLNIGTGFALSEVLRLRKLFREQKFHLIHLHGARVALYGRLAVIGLRPRPHTVFSIHGFSTPFYSFPKRTVYLGIERLLQRVTSHTIAVAQAEADLFLSFNPIGQDQISVIPYGIDVARFSATQSKNSLNSLRQTLGIGQGHIILTVCRLNIPRDFESLLTAFRNLLIEFPTTHLLIVGDGPQLAEVQALIEQLGLTQAVQITGFRNDIPDLMALADIYTLTSYGWEGYPISSLEAQSAATPVVVTDAGGSKEAVLHEKTGLIVPKCRPDLLFEAWLRLLKEPDLRQQLGEAGQKRAKSEFTISRMIKKIVALYDRFI